MDWFRKKAPARVKPLTRWTPELWGQLMGTPSAPFCVTVLLRRFNSHGEWIYGSRGMSGHDEYKGSLLHEEGSPLQHVSVTLGFDTHEIPSGRNHGDAQTLGLASTGAYGSEREGFPLFNVSIWGQADGALAFARAFDRAVASGHDHLQVWLFAEQRTPPLTEIDDFAVIQPLTRIRFEQSIRLGVRR